MDVKTESKLLLSALLLLPFGAGVLMLISDSWGLYPYIMFFIGLVGLLYLWIPRKWFRKEEEHKGHKSHKQKKH
jgi:hypothetical protein